MIIAIYRNYSSTILLTPSYSIGFCVSIFLLIQIISGFLLASHYIANTENAFNVIHSNLMRDLDSGWLLRHIHSNGASFFFIFIYFHIIRCLYSGSPSKSSVWLIGIIMYILLCAISFTGYSLVYGQMSLWAIVVICSLVTAIPYIGNDILTFLWGGSIVSSSTLQRVFLIHFLLPIILFILFLIHLYLLHSINSSGEFPIVLMRSDRINFYPLLLYRDLFIGSIVLIFYTYILYFYSDLLGHADNYIPANPMVTPPEIMPEFYFLPFYAIIRAIPHKTIGIIIMFFILLSLTNILPSINFYNNNLFTNNVRWWSGSMTTSCTTFLSRSLLFIFILDILLASKLCLLVNHFDSMYWLLLINVLSISSSELIINK